MWLKIILEGGLPHVVSISYFCGSSSTLIMMEVFMSIPHPSSSVHSFFSFLFPIQFCAQNSVFFFFFFFFFFDFSLHIYQSQCAVLLVQRHLYLLFRNGNCHQNPVIRHVLESMDEYKIEKKTKIEKKKKPWQ